MRPFAILMIALVFGIGVQSLAAKSKSETVTLSISGMSCESCATGIRMLLERTDGVIKAEVRYESRDASVVFDPAKTSDEAIIAVIEKMGYKASVKK